MKMEFDVLPDSDVVDLEQVELIDWVGIFACCAYSQFSSWLEPLDEEEDETSLLKCESPPDTLTPKKSNRKDRRT